jgi:protein required for attachment to host cells
MPVTWVLVADKSRARIFSKNGRSPFREEEGFIHPESRMHEQQLTSDLPGSDGGGSNGGGQRHGKGPRVSPKRHEAQVFCKQVADHLEAARAEQRFQRLLVVAPPAFLGLLREQFSPPLGALVTREVNKNLVHLKADELREQLPVLL